MTPTQQLIREIVDSFIPEYSNIAVFDDDRINGYEIVPAKPFILAKISQVLESVEKEIEGEKQNVVFMSKSDPVVQEAMLMVGALNQGLDRAITLLKEARDAAGSNTGGV